MTNKQIANIFILSSLLIVIILMLCAYQDGYNIGTRNIKFDVTGQFGDFVGGVIGTIISAAGFYFLYLTFNDQRSSFEKERLENKFFDLIKIHRENVSELKFDAKLLEEDDDSLHIEKEEFNGKAVFNVIFNQIIICKNELGPIFKKQEIFNKTYLDELNKISFISTNNIDIKTLAKIDICYCIVYYGVTPEGLLILRNIFKNRYNPKLIDDILRYITLKPSNDAIILAKWRSLSKIQSRTKKIALVKSIYDWRETKQVIGNTKIDDICTQYHNRFAKYYTGHQFRLGHYYRHLYQSVNFINNQTAIPYREKYDYIRILRAQLSTYEQAVLFFNSLSVMGEAWEMKPIIKNHSNKNSLLNAQLITKYNLIKNIPGEKLYGISFKKFYPGVNYENTVSNKNRPHYS